MEEKNTLTHAVALDNTLQLRYAGSLLRRYVKDFSAEDVVRLCKSNQRLLRPAFYLKRYIRTLRCNGNQLGVYNYSFLLKELKEYAPDFDRLDVEETNREWFVGFKSYLDGKDGLKEKEKEKNDCIRLFWKIYAETCRTSRARVLYSADGRDIPTDCQGDNLDCSLSDAELCLSAKESGNINRRNVCQLLLVKRQTGMNLSDLLELKEEDLFDEGIWYRKSKDNRLTFVSLPANTVALLRKNLSEMEGNGKLFVSPYDDMEDEHMRLDLAGKWYIHLLKGMSCGMDN